MKMKAVSIRQPWAGLIASGVKTVEYRSWNTNTRGDVLIVAGKTVVSAKYAAEQYKECRGLSWPSGYVEKFGPYFRTGVAICIVDLYDVHYDPVFEEYEWLLRNPRPLAKPFPVQGKLKWFDVDVPEAAL
jgi:hypothetical protein